MDTAPDPRPELTAAQRIAIALGTAPDPTDPTPPAADRAVDPDRAAATVGGEPSSETPA